MPGMEIIALLTLVCVLTYTFEIVFGLAGTIMMLVIMTFFMDAKTLVIYSVLPQILVAVIGLWRSPRNVELRELGRMLGFAAVGGVFGLYLFRQFSLEVFHALLALAITVFGAFLVITPQRVRLPNAVLRALDTLAGASQTLFGISGPIAMTRLLATHEDKLLIRNYALAFFLMMNLFRTGSYVVSDTFTRDVLVMMLISAPFLVVTLWYTSHWHAKVNNLWFRRVVSWAILLGGGIMLFTAPRP
jgi:uncharacterized membrane protein YfcA